MVSHALNHHILLISLKDEEMRCPKLFSSKVCLPAQVLCHAITDAHAQLPQDIAKHHVLLFDPILGTPPSL